MPTEPKARTGEPTFGDYVKEAFNIRVHVPGLGGLPVNWLYLVGVGIAGVALPPLWLAGAAGEIALLAGLSSSRRFQTAARARLKARHGAEDETALDTLVTTLSQGSRAKHDEFEAKCDEILSIAQRLGHADSDMLETYSVHLAELRKVYARMLMLLQLLFRYTADWERNDPAPKIEAIEKELAGDDVPDSVRKSREATLEILRRRLESRKQISARAHVIQSELARLEQQIALIRDEALLTRDPAVLSESMDAAAGVLEEHTVWLQENEALLEGLDQSTPV